MSPEASEWLNLCLRWFHVFAAILWIGTTAFFTWLDARMRVEADPATGKEEVWMVHSGGFYVVEKRRSPDLTGPHPLHWWKWEAAFTWLSGFLLLFVVYPGRGSLVPLESAISIRAARALAVGTLLVAWAVYDVLFSSRLARNEPVAALVSFALLILSSAGLREIFEPRAAYILTGAIMGTIMTANVWMRIIPAQRRMVAAVREGRAPDPAMGERAKKRSKHNTFMAVPVTFIMISNHFGAATTRGYGTLMLAGFILLGFAARKIINLHDAKR